MNYFLKNMPLLPERASSVAGGVDALFWFIVGVSAFFTVLIYILVTVFAVKYRRRQGNMDTAETKSHLALEMVWTIIPLILALVMFFWGAKIFFRLHHIPPDAMEVFVIGKQWMWKIQHPTGQREINELHVPVGKPVKLTMISEDVIHDFFVPAFRTKRDVLPGRYTMTWFEATKTGKYHLFCSQYCGAEHSLMTGWVHVMEPNEYQAWLSGGVAGESMQAAGERLFNKLGCVACHKADSSGRGPSLVGLYGRPVQLQNGEQVTADEDFLRLMITEPGKKIVAGYQPIMPTFKGLVTEENVLQLIAYIKSLSPAEGAKAK